MHPHQPGLNNLASVSNGFEHRKIIMDLQHPDVSSYHGLWPWSEKEWQLEKAIYRKAMMQMSCL